MSIIQVAERAGVSVSTVSRVINRQPGVAPETEERVRAVMEELGYVPPDLAHRRGPKPNGSGTLSGGVVLLLLGQEVHLGIEGGFMLSRIEAGLHEGAAEHGGLVCVSCIPESHAEPLRLPLPHTKPRAICTLSPHVRTEHLAAYGAVPCVHLMAPPLDRHVACDVVSPDNAAVGRLAATHLLAHGHREMAVINPFCCWASAAERVGAFVGTARLGGAVIQVLDNAAVREPWGDAALPPLDRRPTACRQLARRLLALTPRPTGVFVVTDAMTAIVTSVLGEAGLCIGKDVELVSCNNDQTVIGSLSPRPLTFDLRPYEVGRHAVELIAARLSGKLTMPPVRLLVPPIAMYHEG